LIAVDTNVLVYAHRRDSRQHEAAARAVGELAMGRAPWAIPWPCLHEFYSIATHPRVYAPPSRPEQALEQLRAWRESPSLVLLAEDDGYWPVLESIVERSRVSGPAIHDARIAALCVRHGVEELWSADRDFSRFPEVRLRNPLLR
jgi:toxin-antitoxin system PIN domain toxin